MRQTLLYNKENLQAVAAIVKKGGLVAFPTETVYGLGADATNGDACQAIYYAKGRPRDNPFIVHIASSAAIYEVVSTLNEVARELLKQFSPGPLTLVLPKNKFISPFATASLNSVGLRIPSHPLAQEFLLACGCPIAAPSANRSGRPSPTDAAMVMAELEGYIDAIIDGGSSTVGLESTVVSCMDDKIQLLRAGSVSLEQLQAALPGEKIELTTTVSRLAQAVSPGQKYRHYQPSSPLFLMNKAEWDLAKIEKLYGNVKIGLLSLNLYDDIRENSHWLIYRFDTLEHYALELYRTLVLLDGYGCDLIVAVLPEEVGLGRALRDRLTRAADQKFI